MQCDELFEFERNKKGFTLTRYRCVDAPDITEIDIPSEYCSKPVTEIGNSAFEGAKYLRSVVIPDSIEQIGTDVFRDCTGLEEVRLPPKINYIPEFMFSGCSSLKSIDIPDGVTAINDNAFAYCVSLEELVLPASMKTIKSAACCYCTNLRSIVFQSNNVKVYTDAFGGCSVLSPETAMLSLVNDGDITAPFAYVNWQTVLRRDVFELVMKYDNFSGENTSMVFYMLFSEGLFAEYYPIMTESGWIYREENAAGFEELLSEILDGTRIDFPEVWECAELWITDRKLFGIIAAAAARRGETKGEPFPDRALLNKLIDHSAKIGRPELTAWLLEYKKRGFGFGAEDKYEL